MTFSQKDLIKIEEMAKVYLPIKDMAALLDLDCETLRIEIKDETSNAGKAYRRGKATSKYELRKQEMVLATAGSPLGLESVAAALTEMEEQEE